MIDPSRTLPQVDVDVADLIGNHDQSEGARSMLGRGRAYIWFLGGLAAIVAGFWPSFYGDPASNDVWHTLHGVAATLWVLLLIAQSILIGRSHRQLHERLGWLSAGLFAALIITSSYMVWRELIGPEPFPAVIRQQLVFLDMAFLLLFIAVYSLGLVYRRTRKLHARLMGSTILIGMAPALTRLFGENIPQLHGLAGALPWSLWAVDAILLVAILLEWGRRQITWPFPAMLAAFVAIELGSSWASGATFAGIARASGAPI
jgi:hypothetical protein